SRVPQKRLQPDRPPYGEGSTRPCSLHPPLQVLSSSLRNLLLRLLWQAYLTHVHLVNLIQDVRIGLRRLLDSDGRHTVDSVRSRVIEGVIDDSDARRSSAVAIST